MKGVAGSNWDVMAVENCGNVRRLEDPPSKNEGGAPAGKSGSRAAALHMKAPRRLTEDICVQEVVAEFAVGVEFFG
jgi:hypothetical protein